MTRHDSDGASRLRDDEYENFLLSAIDSSSEGFILVGEDLRIRVANRAAANMLGSPPERLRGADISDPRREILRRDGSILTGEERLSILKSIQSSVREEGKAVYGLRRPGGLPDLWIEVGSVGGPAEAEGLPDRTLLILSDITERKRTEEEFVRKIRVQNAIKDYSILLAGTALDDIYGIAAREGKRIFGARTASIASYDAERKAYIPRDIAWTEGKQLAAAKPLAGAPLPVSDEEYRVMLGMKVGSAANMYALGFGKVPGGLGETPGETSGTGWFRGLALVSQGSLFGGLVLAGPAGGPEPDSEELLVFAEITADAIMHKLAEAKAGKLLEEKELILHEVHHRIKNNMITMISLLSLQSRELEKGAASDVIKDAIGRLQSMSTLYDKLFLAEDLREMSLRDYLPDLCNQVVGMFPNRTSVAIQADLCDERFSIKRLANLGIMMNEIVTNSMKYAFPCGRSGKIILTSKIAGDRITIEIGDDGVGMPEAVSLESHPGFGLGLIRILAKQMDARVALIRDGGTRFAIELARG